MFFFCFLFLFAKIESKRLYFYKIEGQVSFGQIPRILQTKCFEVDIFTFKYNFTAQTSKKPDFSTLFRSP